MTETTKDTELEQIIKMAEFMGYVRSPCPLLSDKVFVGYPGVGILAIDIEEFNYSTSYDQLIPVWVKFRDMDLPDKYKADHRLRVNVLSNILAQCTLEEFFIHLSHAIYWISHLTIV